MNWSHGNKCIVADCQETGNAGFFSLPKNNEKRKKWLEGIKAVDWFWAVTSEDRIKDTQKQEDDVKKKKKLSVCFRHFKKEDIKVDGKYLKPMADAVPVSTILTFEIPTLKAKIEEESLNTPEKSKEDYEAEVANLKLYIKRIEDKHAEEITKKDILIGQAQKHNGSLRGENDRLKRLIRKRNKQFEKNGVAKVTKKKQVTNKKQDKIVIKEVLNSYDMNTDVFLPDPVKIEPTDKGAKKKIKLSKIDSQNVSNSNEIHKNQISNEEFLDPNRIDIKEDPLDENHDMNADVFLPDPVKIEPKDENVYNDCDNDPLAS